MKSNKGKKAKLNNVDEETMILIVEDNMYSSFAIISIL